MTIFIHEMKQNIKTLTIWTAVVGGMVLICMLMFPEMEGQMEDVSDMFASMGGFTEAFGMDKINFGTAMGFYGIECGNILGIGGGFFAALVGVKMLAKEESEHTAEFILSHPVSRGRVVSEKLAAVIVQLIIFNLVVVGFAVGSFFIIDGDIDRKAFWLFHLAQFIMQLEIAALCFGLSAFFKRGSIGIGLGFAALLYFLNIVGNISEKADFLKYITPFKYADAADIISERTLDTGLIWIGAAYGVATIIAAYIKYTEKDVNP